MIRKITRFLFVFASAGIIFPAGAQNNINSSQTNLLGQYRVITTAVPFLLITPDSRSGGMADAGVAISPDANTMHWNPAKLAFEEDPMGFSVSYTPWLRELVPDINLSYLGGYKKIDEYSGFGASLRYFTLGNITFTDNFGNELRTFSPNELAVDLGYARKLSDHFSIGVSGRFIYSDLAGVTTLQNGSATKPAVAGAGDVSGYYTMKKKYGPYNGDLSFGFNISNMGNKITYTNQNSKDFLPANLKIGAASHIVFDEYNELTIALDLNKLLVPTPPVYRLDSVGRVIYDQYGNPEILAGKSQDQPVIQGMINSFFDAPGGFREELQEINPSLGFEYWYDKQIAARAGYFYEAPNKGDRQYVTLGVGVKYKVLQIDFAYLVPTTSQKSIQHSPLENTLRFTLQFNFSKSKTPKNEEPPATAPGDL